MNQLYRFAESVFSLVKRAWKGPQKRWQHRLWRPIRLLSVTFFLFLLGDLCFPVQTQVAYAPLVKSRDSSALYAFLGKDQQWRMFIPLEDITPELSQALIFKEDKYFYYHPGINVAAVSRALFNNLLQHRRTSGASTLTMQVARMLEPKRRSYWNKLIECFRALQLEWHYSKKEILQLYLNLAPYGSNIQGVKAASLLYFQKYPDQLSLAEITTLSIIPNRPRSLVMGKDNDKIVQERNKWLDRFAAAKLFPAATIRDAKTEELHASRVDAPQAAPQLAWRMRRMFPQTNDIVSSIDPLVQRKAQELTANYSRSLFPHAIYNASVIVVDNNTMEVLAYVGSPDFRDTPHEGQVDGVKACRSPGSTLKPLLYGLAFDKGIVTPATVLNDIPVDFGGYMPENYDLGYRGKISVADALRQSLNIPAVRTLHRLSVPVFLQEMQLAGFRQTTKDQKKMGLSLILGGCGVRLEELAAMYAALANKGRYRPLRWQPSPKAAAKDSGIRLLSEPSAYVVTQILRELQRPDLPQMTVNAMNIPQVAWKTGTSYGRRDAWSIGYNTRYTIGVWVGNFNGKGAPELNGAGVATPLLFQLFQAIDRSNTQFNPQAPPGLAYRMVCPETGLVPGAYCTEQIIDAYLPGISSNESCRHRQMIYLSADGQFSYCTSCLPANGYKMELRNKPDPELAAYYEEQHIGYDKIPEHNPACSRNSNGDAPKITSLTAGTTYLITDKGKQTLQLACAAATDVHKVYWYINDRFAGSGSREEKLQFAPDAPNIKISCTDDKGRTSHITIVVKFI
jgi:penicillin-binding protein 1C